MLVVMRIAHVVDSFQTDVGYQEYYLAMCMAEAGHTVEVITTHHRHHAVVEPGPDEAAGLADLVASGVVLHRLEARPLGHDRYWIHRLEDALDAFGPDAVHCHGPFGPTAVRVARHAPRLGYRLLVDNHMHELIAPGSTRPAARAAYMTFRQTGGRVLRRRVDQWVAIGPYEADFLSLQMGIPRADVHLVPLGFEPGIFHWDGERRRTRREERGWDGDTVVSITGKIHPGKRPELTAAAGAAAFEAGRPVRLVVAGSVEPAARRAIEAAAGPLADDRLEWFPMLGRHDLADLYRDVDVVVFARLPSISIYEAAGTGVRVLVGRDRFSEWLSSLSVVVEAVDPAGLADLLVPADDRAGRAAEAAAAFSWEGISRRFLDLYRPGP